MHPSRAGLYNLHDVESTPYSVHSDIIANALTTWSAAPKLIMRSVTPRFMDSEQYVSTATITDSANIRSFALGVLLNGSSENRWPGNFTYNVGGVAHVLLTSDIQQIEVLPIIARLDGAPVSTQTIASPEFDPTTITKYQNPTPNFSSKVAANGITVGWKGTIGQGEVNGRSARSHNGIFVGWQFIVFNNSGANKTLQLHASINAHKWVGDFKAFNPKR